MAWPFDSRRGARGEREPGAPVSDADDRALIERHRAGDQTVFEALYRRHAAALYRTALAMTRSASLAEELLQEAFLSAFRHLDQVQLRRDASLRPWLRRILVNRIYDEWARRRPPLAETETGIERMAASGAVSPERQAEEGEVAHAVGDALARLPFKQRVVATLYYLDDMDVQEIADLLGVPEGTVKSRLHYGRARLRTLLAADARVGFGAVPEAARA